jgi:hypothetical protein
MTPEIYYAVHCKKKLTPYIFDENKIMASAVKTRNR